MSSQYWIGRRDRALPNPRVRGMTRSNPRFCLARLDVASAAGLAKWISMMRHYPIFMDMQERRAFVVGSGEVAERKAEALRRCGALVDIHPAFAPRALDGCALALGGEAPEADLC